MGLGNIVILQNDDFPTQTLPGIFDTPNDEADGGTIVFDFVSPLRLLSIDLIDMIFGAVPITLDNGIVTGATGLAAHPQLGELWALLKVEDEPQLLQAGDARRDERADGEPP